MVLWHHVMLCGNTLLRVQLARCVSYVTWWGTGYSQSLADKQNKYKIDLKQFLHTYSFYTIEEYLSQSWIRSISQDTTILVRWFKESVYEHYITTP